jgi:putative CocE/NonD family hydrolase
MRALSIAYLAALVALPAIPQQSGDIPKSFTVPTADFDYAQRDVMIPMRDGVKLFTVITVPKGAKDAPILLSRTPYNAAKRMSRNDSPRMISKLAQGDDVWVAGGYIRVTQDIRGKYKSEGDYWMTRPVRGPLNSTEVDHTTDTYDTIDWLVKNVPESNGRVGMIGCSYGGFTVVMGLLDPHPALKVAAPESPMVDGWMGDDWFHYGAFRQMNFDYFAGQTTHHAEGDAIVRGGDDYDTFRRAGSAGAFARAHGLDQLPWTQKIMEHASYDGFWEGQALDKIVAQRRSPVPTLWVQGLWDQEDMWGAIHSYLALKKAGQADHNYLVMGPWAHCQCGGEAYSLGPLRWDGDTALQYRRDVLRPFFDQYLKPGAPKVKMPAATIYNTGENHWDRFQNWPPADTMKPIYLREDSGLAFERPAAGGNAADSYVSDPAKPVPYIPRPLNFHERDRWRPWLVTDQRSVADRPDVLVYQTAPLAAPVRISGAPSADLFAGTTGTDADWVVKLIDVYPDEMPNQPEMSGYQLSLSMEIFRGRYRQSFAQPSAIPANQSQRYRFTLPPVNHAFLPDHRIMVQIQSSWFPLYDRNPQTYVPNIFFAKPSDYQKATHSVYRSAELPSAVWLPVTP